MHKCLVLLSPIHCSRGSSIPSIERRLEATLIERLEQQATKVLQKPLDEIMTEAHAERLKQEIKMAQRQQGSASCFERIPFGRLIREVSRDYNSTIVNDP